MERPQIDDAVPVEDDRPHPAMRRVRLHDRAVGKRGGFQDRDSRSPRGTAKEHMMEQTADAPRGAVTARPGLDGRIRRYWTRRSGAFGQVRREELHSDKSSLWRAEILPWLPRSEEGAAPRILDLGTGAGFFAILLAQAGCEVTGIDLSEGMLAQAAALADEAGCTVDWRCMSATELDFGEAAFDGVLARNLTWTLTDPEAAYAEWLRVLRPGGVLLNFDADYGAVDFTRLAEEQGQHAHADMDRALLQEGEAIRRALPLSRRERPQWDMEALARAGFVRCSCDTGLSGRIFARRDATYNPVPMFTLRAYRP